MDPSDSSQAHQQIIILTLYDIIKHIIPTHIDLRFKIHILSFLPQAQWR